MKIKSPKNRWQRLLYGLGKKPPKELTSLEKKHMTDVRQRLKTMMIQEAGRPVISSDMNTVKHIAMDLEILPFEFTCRSSDPAETGRVWRHTGGKVEFELRMPHDKLDIYTSQGEYIRSYPILHSGKVEIDDLEPGVYVLSLYGRKIRDLESRD